MRRYILKEMIIDQEDYGEESVTTLLTYNQQDYGITFKKEDLDIINAWMFKNQSSLPAELPEDLLEALREEIRNKI
ncbi:hypothetical protein [Pseudoneobacillus sp. C159]